MVSDHKGLNLPGVAVSVPALSEKDIDDLRWALRIGADVIALSFVRSAPDIDDVHRIMDEEGRRLPVIAKIEKPQAVDNIDDIVAAFDGIMVARGDLGVEMPLEQVPIVQKRRSTRPAANAKPVIVATQMLDSMIDNSRPTRAEASDVANAVIDGTDAVMLSGETSVGKYPDRDRPDDGPHRRSRREDSAPRACGRSPPAASPAPRAAPSPAPPPRWATSSAPSSSSPSPRAATPPAASPATAHPIPLLAFTPDAGHPLPARPHLGRRDLPRPARRAPPTRWSRQVDEQLLRDRPLREGDIVVITAGSPPGVPGSTNALRIHRMGDSHQRGGPAYRRS